MSDICMNKPTEKETKNLGIWIADPVSLNTDNTSRQKKTIAKGQRRRASNYFTIEY